MTRSITFISAGAGSGKTQRLTEILHTKLVQGAVRPSGVIATTFTIKAAAELRERARAHLMNQREFQLATSLDQARIGTVNSVCGELLLRFAFEAGLPTEQQVLDEAHAQSVLKQAMDSVAYDLELKQLTELTARLGIDSWEEELKTLVDHARANGIDASLLVGMGDQNADELLAHFPRPTSDDLDALLMVALKDALPVVKALGVVSGRKNTAECLRLFWDGSRKLGNGTAAWADWIKLAKAAPEVALKPMIERVIEIAGRHGEHPRLHSELRAYLSSIFSLCARVLKEYAERKRDLGLVDFVDQEHLLLNLLDHAEVQATLRDELDLLLVDEFQDTSPIQLAVFLKLASLAREVYWVGDVKQAIYGFRGSDTALMEAVLRSLPSIGGTKEILGSSRRSRPPLVSLVNEVFGNAFAPTLEAKEVRLHAERQEPGTGAAFANWILAGASISEEIVALGLGIRRLLDSGYQIIDRQTGEKRLARYGDIAVLARMNGRVVEIAASLAAQKIPTATAQPGLLERPEVVLAIACLRRLVDSRDTIATAEILSLAECQEPEIWLQDRLRFLEETDKPGEWQEAGESAHWLVRRLATLRSALPMLIPREALELVITHGDLPRIVLQWNQDEEMARARLANLEALCGLAQQYEDTCRSTRTAATISGLILWLAAQAKGEMDELPEPDLDAVKVLTHHGAKGLEWPIVILIDLSCEIRDCLWSISARSRRPLDLAHPLDDRFIRCWPWPYGLQRKLQLADDIAQTQLAQTFRTEAVSEAKRLLYVSMTRARDMLILGRSSRNPDGPWIDTLCAPWLLPDDPGEELTLPDGTSIPYQQWELHPAEIQPVIERAPQVLHWFREGGEATIRMPLVVAPSGAEPVPSTVRESVQIGTRVALSSSVEMDRVGSAIHSCIAAAMGCAGLPLNTEEIGQILSGWQLDGKLDAAEVHLQIGALRAWIEQRWPNAKLGCEIPVSARLDNGQVVSGQIDLLLDTPSGWILIDHKTNPRGQSAFEEIGRQYSGQLKLYKEAIERATSRPVLECWLYFPVAAGAVSVAV